jgi:ParB family transcriptional regulator, chromosome partitioning protein
MKMNKEVVMVKLSDIIPNRFQPRLTFDEEALNELASSIKEHGIIQPLILRDLGSKYEIIAGERRYKASTIAGLTEVPAIVGTMDDQTSAELALIENIQRKDLSAIEEAKSYKKILDMGNFTQEELAKRMGKSQSTIANKMRLLNYIFRFHLLK